jgi:hypothetical protein
MGLFERPKYRGKYNIKSFLKTKNWRTVAKKTINFRVA